MLTFLTIVFVWLASLSIGLKALTKQSTELGLASLAALVATWFAFAAYEAFLIDCPLAKCNIRPDLLIIVPFLLLISGVCFTAIIRCLDAAGREKNSGPNDG